MLAIGGAAAEISTRGIFYFNVRHASKFWLEGDLTLNIEQVSLMKIVQVCQAFWCSFGEALLSFDHSFQGFCQDCLISTVYG